MKAGRFFQTSLVVVVFILVVIAGADAKKRNKKHPPDSPGRLKDAPKKGSISSAGAHDTVAEQDNESTTVAPAKEVPQADPAVAPEVEATPSKQKGKHRNRGGRRNRDQPDAAESSDVVQKEVKDKANRKKDRSEKKKHHKKHNREDTITTTTASMNGDVNELPDPVAENEPIILEATAETVVDGEPLVEPEVELDEGVVATMVTTTTMSARKHNRDRGGKRMRDEAQTEREARRVRKEQKKMEKQENRKHRKHSDPADEVEIIVNPTPSPAVDGIKLTPSGTPPQTTQQQPTQTEPDTNRKDKKKNKKQKLAEETELSKTEKKIQRIERKMQRMGNKVRKNATKVPCDDHENCQEGQCCLLRRGKKVCHVVNKPEGHHCVHPCMCSEGLTCLGKNRKQKSLSKGHCRRVDITETVGEGAVADNQAPATVDNELPQ